ncbi:hypothetical protein BX616_011301 [Lobosporangium transversale]|uniref:Telomere-associated protein Rif1 N-terminal domain-containing protein n=1 Tax=Lobosporangium transversale TaxID=64571 RepID=A0A1Y2GB99_9FUNG|nr:hypothetical protein BCR41DRAFT_362259 [Lobosporangium transversale]KAF9909088.1 hypothetical protein BX616_011301 [Lobosporangium transversale]ORZ04795.1 hypothetical protein BCR41DRAFT_362259 [Lobosporangium transversale]|eukprot:XP_021876732.1 hypothetical protein BCR41DRAFT_362259 [Lobosporangium transversale]
MSASTNMKRKAENTALEQAAASKCRRLPVACSTSHNAAESGPSTSKKRKAEDVALEQPATPAKRVVFTFQEPREVSTAKLKGILKSSAPVRILSWERMLDHPEVKNPHMVRSRGDSYPEGPVSVERALALLGARDTRSRFSAYQLLSIYLKEGRGELLQQESVRAFAQYFVRDLDSNNHPSLIQAALKCTSHFLSNQSIAVMFTQGEVQHMMMRILHLVNTTNEARTCHLAVWILASNEIPSRWLLPFLLQMIQALTSNLDSRFEASSITSGCLDGISTVFARFPNEAVATTQTWFKPVLTKSKSTIPRIQSKALRLMRMAILAPRPNGVSM